MRRKLVVFIAEDIQISFYMLLVQHLTYKRQLRKSRLLEPRRDLQLITLIQHIYERPPIKLPQTVIIIIKLLASVSKAKRICKRSEQNNNLAMLKIYGFMHQIKQGIQIKSQRENKVDRSASSVTNMMYPASSASKSMYVSASSVTEESVLSMDLKMNPHLIEKHGSAEFCQWRLVYSRVGSHVFINIGLSHDEKPSFVYHVTPLLPLNI